MSVSTVPDGMQPWMLDYTPEQLLKLKEFMDDTPMPWTASWYSMNSVIFIVALYGGAKVIHALLTRFGPTLFAKLKEAQQRVVIVHVLEIIVTTIMFICQVYCAPVYWGNFDKRYLQFGGILSNMGCLLYAFELIYRCTMRTSLLVHHLATMFLISFIFAVMYKTQHPAYFQLGLSFVYQATTEQSTFIGLLMYRFLKPARTTALTLYFAAIQTLVCKFASLFHSIYVWAKYLVHVDAVPKDYHTAFSVVFTLCFVCLLGTQVWGAWVVWILGKRVDEEVGRGGVVGSEKWRVEFREVGEERVQEIVVGEEEKGEKSEKVLDCVTFVTVDLRSDRRPDTPSTLVDVE
ncbi:hypothetical protein HDV00_007258 [Rhizophlyctis rosea]|nr:hypothetical protein HDV00_007258 [Rhizophlyctis rosea]